MRRNQTGRTSGPKIFFLIIIPCLSFQVNGQSRVSGKVLSDDGNPLSFANVILLQAGDSSMVKGEVASAEGSYAFKEIGRGHFMILTSMVGYQKTYSSVFTVQDGDVVLDPLTVAEDRRVLDEVTVKADKPLFEQQMDRLVVNIENSITAAGGTVLEILERSPGVTVNRQSNTLSVAGKQGVLVMINGKVQRLPVQTIVQMLSGMNAGSVEKIEIISNPSSKYDAQGDGGIINIVFKENPDLGTNGSATLTYGMGWREKYFGSFNINHRTRKVNVFADYSLNLNRTEQTFFFARSFDNESTSTNSERVPNHDNHRGSVGADFFVTSKTTVGVLASAYDDQFAMDAVNNSFTLVNNETVNHVVLRDNELNHWKNVMANINLRHTFTKGQLLSIDADYLYYHDNNPHFYRNTYNNLDEGTTDEEEIKISKKTPINMAVFKGDYEFPLGKLKMESGVKYSLSRLKNKVEVLRNTEGKFVEDSEFSQDYRLKDDVAAAYVTLSTDLNEKVKMQAGLRTESTDMEITNAAGEKVFDLNFWSLFPTLFISRQINKDQSLQFSYGRRITRPSYEDIAPFVVFIDPNSYFSGNPNLKPTLTNNFQVSFLHKEFLMSLKYSRDRNFIANYQPRYNEETDKTFFYSENMDLVNTYNLNISFPVKIAHWWKTNTNINGNYQAIKTVYDGVAVEVEQFSASVNATQSFTFGKGYSAEVSAMYMTSSIFGVFKLNDLGSVSVGFQKELNKNLGTIRLNASDIFWMNIWEFNSRQETSGVAQRAIIKFESRVVRLSYTKKFGRTSVKSGRGRSTASDAERTRVKN
jgi:outer membrane receptor protein involved in Fe transport